MPGRHISQHTDASTSCATRVIKKPFPRGHNISLKYQYLQASQTVLYLFCGEGFWELEGHRPLGKWIIVSIRRRKSPQSTQNTQVLLVFLCLEIVRSWITSIPPSIGRFLACSRLPLFASALVSYQRPGCAATRGRPALVGYR